MTDTVVLEFDALPSMVRRYPDALLDRSPPLLPDGITIPRIEARIDAIRARPSEVSRYAVVCGYAPGDTLPFTYPHVLAAPLHMAMFMDPAFGVRLMGLVHVSNRVRQYRRLDLGSVMDFSCSIEGHEDTDRGQEFELDTIVHVDGELAWEETSTFLARQRRRRGRQRRTRNDASKLKPVEEGEVHSSFGMPADIGRRYARVSGDYNPIHLFGITAKLFGFQGAIAHGMWTMAHSVAELERGAQALVAADLEVEFKLPALLPGWIMLRTVDDDAGSKRFGLFDEAGGRPYLIGALTRN